MTDMTDARVKPLVWTKKFGVGGPTQVATGVCGPMEVSWGWHNGQAALHTLECTTWHPTPEAAKAAAQADYEARILSALEPPAAPVPVMEWACGDVRASVDHSIMWLDHADGSVRLTREQFASLLAAGPGLLAAMGEG